LTEDRLSLREWKERKIEIRKQGKAIDQTSTLAQQRDLNNFGNEKVKEMNQKKRGKGKAKTLQNRKDEHQRIVNQTPDRYELSKALLAHVETSESATADRSTLSEVEATDAATISPTDTKAAAVPLKSKVVAEVQAAIIGKVMPQVSPQRIIQPALLVVSSSDRVDDDW
jgi:hypothetical protein